MPRTVDEILQHAEELAARFEDYEPREEDELDPGAVALLRTAVAERSEAERHMIEAVRRARAAGLSWKAIGGVVGTSGEAARQRYSAKVA
ncbi:hypothetical protein FB458_1554 [Lapillicoccus jejuensis]|uniref:Sigma-70-like protein n=2 Tax=Lapillicoccus jejuensis TaxID=402171 RepID=A0A542DZV4_9MICO|nr:hypothetical protein FB458_1554 [Lapillicoccus jejuensis]